MCFTLVSGSGSSIWYTLTVVSGAGGTGKEGWLTIFPPSLNQHQTSITTSKHNLVPWCYFVSRPVFTVPVFLVLFCQCSVFYHAKEKKEKREKKGKSLPAKRKEEENSNFFVHPARASPGVIRLQLGLQEVTRGDVPLFAHGLCFTVKFQLWSHNHCVCMHCPYSEEHNIPTKLF